MAKTERPDVELDINYKNTIQLNILRLTTNIAALLVLIISFSILTVLVLNNTISIWESSIYTTISFYITPLLTRIMIMVTNMGSTVAVISIAFILLTLPLTRKKIGFPVAVNAAGTAILNIVLKNVIARPRPEVFRLITETGYGFPSGHAMNNAALYTMILLVVFRQTQNKKIRIIVMLFSLAMPFFIGISRIYLGVHNAGDILAGWIMGVFCALMIDTILEILYVKCNKDD